MKVEFAGGGPADGNQREFPEGMPVIRIFTPRTEAGFFVNIEEADDKSPIHAHETHVYRRQNRLTAHGCRVYVYAGRELP
jgi:hypothetical protein